jgi:DNA-binding beta-propeller fold protein YncE
VAIAVNPSNGEVAVSVQGSAPALAVIDPNNLTSNALSIPVQNGQPMQVAVDSVTGKFFVARGGLDPVLLVLRPASTAFDNSIPVTPGVTGIAIDRNSQIYLSHASGVASVIDGTTGNPVAEVPIGAGSNQVSDAPNHAAVDPDSTPTRIYMVDTASGTLSILTQQEPARTPAAVPRPEDRPSIAGLKRVAAAPGNPRRRRRLTRTAALWYAVEGPISLSRQAFFPCHSSLNSSITSTLSAI